MRTKRFLAALLAAIMTFACFSAVSFAAGAIYDQNFDGLSSGWPSGWRTHFNSNLATGYEAGKDGFSNATDKSFRFVAWYGFDNRVITNPDEVDFNLAANDFGKKMEGADIDRGGNTYKNTTIVYNTDFKLGAKTVWLTPVLPVFKSSKGEELFPVSLNVKEGKVRISTFKSGTYTVNMGDANDGKTSSGIVENTVVEIDTMNADEWHNAGAKITHSEAEGVTIDIYFDSSVVYTFKSTDAAYKTAVLDEFRMPVTSTYLNSGRRNPQNNNEWAYVDNFYIGDDIKRLTPDFKIKEMIPAEGTKVPVDGDISLVMNQSIFNAANVPNSIWLTKKDGSPLNFGNIINEATYVDKDTLTGVLGDKLYYSEEYTLNVSENLVNGDGKNLDTEVFKFKTKSMFPVNAEVVDYEKSTGIATAKLEFDGNRSAMKLVMASYAEDGTIADYTVQDIAANDDDATISVSYLNDETIKIFAVDGFDTANLVMEPITDGQNSKSYKQESATVSVGNATTYQRVITVTGAITNSERGWVVTKIAKKGNEDSGDIADYLSFDAIQTDDNGSFKFAGKVTEDSGIYVYKAIAADSGNDAEGEVEYNLDSGTELLSLKLGGKKCTQDGNTFYLRVRDTDVSGLLAEFTVSENAAVFLNDERLISGESRINCLKNPVLKVVAETEEYQLYNIVVDVEETDDYDDRNDNLTVIMPSDSYNDRQDLDEIGAYEERVFKDVPKGHWAMTAIEALYEQGIVGGKGDGTFAPNALITREEFASMVAKAFKFAPNNTRPVFIDIPEGAWYEDSVYALADNDIVSGVEKFKFGVGQTITRQDMTVILHRVIMNGSIENVRDYQEFKDQNKISAYAKEAVEAMYKAGYVSGMDDGTFNPFGGTTKAMAAYMIYLIMN